MQNDQNSFPFEDSLDDGEPLDSREPLTLLLGWVDHEGIVSSLKSSKRFYKKKLLESKPENWDSISDYFEQCTVSCVLIKITAHVCYLLTLPEYVKARNRLFKHISSVPNITFVYEDILNGKQLDEFREGYKPYPQSAILDEAISFLESQEIRITPYRANAEVTVLAESFLVDIERNLIFRLYVPRERLWSSEADRFLQLFQDFLCRVDGLSVRLDQKRTDHGVVYEFHGDTQSNCSQGLQQEFDTFSQFLDMCAIDSQAAGELLAARNVSVSEATRIVEKYSKEARRLQLDIRHESESKMTSIRHRMESELLDLAPTKADWDTLSKLIEAVTLKFPTGLPSPSIPIRSAVPLGALHGAITYNVNPKFIHVVNGIVADEIQGNQHFAPEMQQLLEVVRQHGGAQARELETATYEIADKGGKQADRLRATQKLKEFLIAAGKRTGDAAFGILQKYVESQLGF
ncbi:hypothetical protein GO285_02981 [Ralstonia solanacearum]|nr:hypothetical protein [Ralstonia solanacearum]NKF88872.1 hypothetical protein [Ralstonia solanacearum]NKF96897.1 hypothetical protein [Ralstonia solanacearum]NKG11164.1 hypothetical protein [Ralstonia solanacearum]